MSGRIISKSKMPVKGPVQTEFTVKGSTPSGKPRLFVCATCTRAFARHEHLKRHERSHTKEKPFTCNICSRKFSRRDLLLRHSTKLHAGAADVITRLRKRSFKSQSKDQDTGNKIDQLNIKCNEKDIVENDINGFSNIDGSLQPPVSFSRRSSQSNRCTGSVVPTSNSLQLPKFPLNGASGDSDIPSSVITTTTSTTDINTHTNTTNTTTSMDNLNYNEGFHHHYNSNIPNNRRASFSAMSGSNYAFTNPEPYASETVEFSTPQFNALEEEQENWLNSLTDQHFEPLPPPSSSSLPQEQGQLQLQEEQQEQEQGPLQEQLHPSSQSSQQYQTEIQELKNLINGTTNKDISPTRLGYSFYDDTEDITKSLNQTRIEHNNHPNDLFQSLVSPGNTGINMKIQNWQETLFNQPITDLERLNDMRVSNPYAIPQGYSFYGVGSMNPSRSSRTVSISRGGILGNYDDNSLSSDATISPILIDHQVDAPTSHKYASFTNLTSHTNTNMDMDLNDNTNTNTTTTTNNDYSNHYNKNSKNTSSNPNNTPHPLRYEHHRKTFEDDFNDEKLGSYSQAFLFTSNMNRLIRHSLAAYPFFGTQTPELMNTDTLNLYVDQFINKFLTHYPFIHKSILNEHSLIKDALEHIRDLSISEIESNHYSKNDLKLVRDDTFTDNFKVSIVCLPLLIATIGAIVSNKREDASNLYEISRRCIHVYLETRKKLKTIGFGDDLSAISNSPLWLVQSLTLSIIYGLFADEEISMSIIICQVNALNTLIKSSKINEVEKPSNLNDDYKVFINYESMIRTIHMIFHVTTLLSGLYNIEPTLEVVDLNIDLPNSSLLWDCLTDDEFHKMIENFNFHTLNYPVVLNKLLDLKYLNSNFLIDNHISEYGLICIQNGLHQLAYSRTELDKLKIIGNSWISMVDNSIIYNKSSEIVNDSKIMNYFMNIKISPIMNLNQIKEFVWLKNYNDVNTKYLNEFNYFSDDDKLQDWRFQHDLIRLIEDCLSILKLTFFNKDNSLMGSISPSFKLNNSTLTKIDQLVGEQLNGDEYELFNRINLNVLHKLSIDSQMLFDVFLIIVKFLLNYEKIFKNKNNLSLLNDFEFNSLLFKDKSSSKKFEQFEVIMFKYYIKCFKMFICFEEFLKHNYNYADFETGQAYDILNNLDTKLQFCEPDVNFIMGELLQFRLPFKILKIGGFLFGFIYDRNYKVANFKYLSDVLFHLRIYLESKEDYV